MRHPFHFDGGEYLTTLGACWFVSYAYYEQIDKTHTAWRNVTTCASRESTYRRTRAYHRYWLEQILKMNDVNLNKNSLHLAAAKVKAMAARLLKTI